MEIGPLSQKEKQLEKRVAELEKQLAQYQNEAKKTSKSGPKKSQDWKEGRCFKCHAKGHLVRNCPKSDSPVAATGESQQ